MKRIQRMNNATAGLAAYLAEKGNEAKDWDGFRSHDAGASYRQLAEALMDIQHGLCGYCEIDIVEGKDKSSMSCRRAIRSKV